ncbi:VOC family protein [Algoriphagus limi]|uniref:VOC family protein n=1 Tax=Algoriphagus limi TaxID=2975273 RepID=A0ABT2G477_9BACT|nr:VOC family protein [Algoriphagus limi]MCS5490082.1 VOC family protein [Algoriphagus limi]
MKKFLTALGAGFILFACSPSAAPPVLTEISTPGYHHGRVVWYNLASPNPEVSKNFYEEVFGWTTIPYGDKNREIWVFKNGDQPVGLMARYNSDNNSGEWIGSISTADVDASASEAKSLGAKILNKPVAVENQGTVAFIQDPQGANFSLINLAKGDPEPKLAQHNSFLGMELWSNDTQSSHDFYTEIAGYETEMRKEGTIDYTVFKMGDMNCAGMLANPAENVRSHWLPYIRVADVQQSLAKAKASGATVLLEPNAGIRNGSVAIILDPTGAPLALQVYNP